MANRYVRSTGGNSNAAGTWELTPGGGETVAVPTSSDDVFLTSTSGKLTVNATLTCKSLDCTGYVNDLYIQAYTINIYGNCTFSSGMTFTQFAGAMIDFKASGTLITAGKYMPIVVVSAGNFVLGDNFTNSGNLEFTLKGTSHDFSGRTVAGYSVTSRSFINSGTPGTSKPITVDGSTVFNNCDFMDIAASTPIDLSGATGGSGDCGGNSNIIFTTSAQQTWSGVTGNWSNSALWTSRVPLPQDDVVIPNPGAASKTLTANLPRLGRSITVTNTSAANKPTLAFTNQNVSLFGSLTFVSSTYMTFSCNKTITFRSRSNASLTWAGKTTSNTVFIVMPSATLTFNDAFSSSSSLQLTNGTLTTDYNVSITTFAALAGTTTNMGSGAWTLSGTNNVWSSAGTVNKDTANIYITYTGTTVTTFIGGTSIYNDIIITPGTGVLTFSGAFTFRSMKRAGSSGTKTITFTKNTNYTMNGDDFFKPGASTNKFTLTGTGTGATDAERWTLTNNTTRVDTDYLDITECKAAGSTSPFYAGANSTTDNSTNTGWMFTAPPSDSSFGWLKVTTRYQLISSPFGGMRR